MTSNGCLGTQETLEEIRYNTERTAENTETIAEIQALAHGDKKGVTEAWLALNKKIDDIEKPKPFEIPEWIKWLLGAIMALLVPDAVNKTLRGAGTGAGLLGKLLNGKKGKS